MPLRWQVTTRARPVPQRAAARRRGEGGGVPAVRVEQEDPPREQIGGAAQLNHHRLGRVCAEGERAGEVRVLAARAVGQRGRDQHPRHPDGQPGRERNGDVGVGRQREVRAVLLGGPDRHDEHRSAIGGDFRPGHLSQ